jgi:SAM-dependent MidA family methyltransferase
MLARWREMGQGGARYRLTVVDGNPEHRRQAEDALETEMTDGRARVLSAKEAESESWSDRKVVVIANELLDAFPVHRIGKKGGKVREWGVAWDDNKQEPFPCLLEEPDPFWSAWLEERGIRLAEGQTADIGIEGAAWPARMAPRLGDAILILIDYGDTAEELTGPHRMDGTLLCYENHRAHSDPYRKPGEIDITAHVDFTLVREQASGAGWKELWYGTQKKFLVESGVMSKLTNHGITDPFHPIVRRNRSIRQLLLSDGMSELFKVQVWTK